MKIELKTLKKLLKLRNILDHISQVSWEFSILNKQYPINHLSNEQANELISVYGELIKKVKNLIENEYEGKQQFANNIQS